MPGAASPGAAVPSGALPGGRLRRDALELLCLAAMVAIGGAAGWLSVRGLVPPAPPSAPPPGPPVIVSAARVADVPVTLDGLGTVQASNTVSVRVMVDGPLTEIRFTEGQFVRRGDLLARIDPRIYQAALDLALAKHAQDSAQLANARVDLARYQKLAAMQYTSAQIADTQQATVAQLQAQLRQDQAQIDAARTNLSYTDITAPVDGRVGLRSIDIGNIVHAADATGLTVLSQLRPINVVFTLPQQALPAVIAAIADRGAQAEARAQTATGAPGAVLDRGSVSILDNSVDTATGTIRLKATFANDGLQLWPGAFVTVRLRLSVMPHAVVVPPAAVQRAARGSFVYVLDAENVVHRRPVTVGQQDAQGVVIASGLRANAAVVIEGANRLSDGVLAHRVAGP